MEMKEECADEAIRCARSIDARGFKASFKASSSSSSRRSAATRARAERDAKIRRRVINNRSCASTGVVKWLSLVALVSSTALYRGPQIGRLEKPNRPI